MEIEFTLIAVVSIIKALSFDKLLRLIFFRIFYPKATIKQLENFEKNTKRNYISNWVKRGQKK